MKVVCFGDSNTFGYDPRSYTGGRYDADSRWVDVLAHKTGWDIRNNGMNGREIPSRESVFPTSTDILIVMLGTNDLLQGKSAVDVAARMEQFLTLLPIARKKILLIAPPPMEIGEWVQDQVLIDRSFELAGNYCALSERLGVHFADAGQWGVSIAFDGVHFTEEGHQVFARELHHYLNPSGAKRVRML